MWLYILLVSAALVPPISSECAAKALDLFFLFDESHTLWSDEVKAEVKFMKDLLVHYNLTKTRVSITGFGHGLRTVIPLGYYKDHSYLNDILDKMKKRGGQTPTAEALDHMIHESRKWRGTGSDTRAQVAIVMSDGRSTNPDQTAAKAKIARDEGIMMFALFFGFNTAEGKNMGKAELSAIASDPDSDHMYLEPDENYADLDAFEEKIVEMTCPKVCVSEGVSYALGSRRSAIHSWRDCECKRQGYNVTCPIYRTYCTSYNGLRDCQRGRSIDLYFVLISYKVTKCDFYRQLAFVKDIISKIDETARIFILSSGLHVGRRLSDYTVTQVHRLIDSAKYGAGENEWQLDQWLSYLSRAAARSYGSHKIAVLITNLESNPFDTDEQKSINDLGILMFTIGVGGRVNQSELKAIANQPYSDFMFNVGSYPQLSSIKDRFADTLCKVVRTSFPTPKPYPQACESGEKSYNAGDTWKTAQGASCMCEMTNRVCTAYWARCTQKTLDCLKCKSGVDLFFIMVNSISPKSNNVPNQLAFIKNVIGNFEIPCTRVSIMAPNQTEWLPPVRPLDCINSKTQLFETIDAIEHSGGRALVGEAIASMRREARDNKGEHDRVLIALVIMDHTRPSGIEKTSEDAEMVREESKMAREDDGFVMYAIGVGTHRYEDELKDIAGDRDNIFVQADYAGLESIKHHVFTQSVCAGGGVGGK